MMELKFLPAHTLDHAQVKARFLQEAQAAAALNHPNICTIHEIDEVDNQLFIAMEYIEGATLKEKIEARPLKLDQALDTAVQIGSGLKAAHDKGVVHRDIKSANVMVIDDGQVKLMDFGLARLGGRAGLTRNGVTLGTPSYMSPEQALGETVDHRTDVWALGVVVYEMVSGQLPFSGDFEAAILYAIAHEEPEPLTALRTGVPAALDNVIAKALAKSAEGRYQDMDELLADLQAIQVSVAESSKQGPKATSRRHRAGRPVSTARNRRTSSRAAKLFGGIALLGIAVAGLGWWLARAREERPDTTPRSYLLTQVTEDPGLTHNPVISPDGKLLAYVSDRGQDGNVDIWLQHVGSGDAVQLTNDEAYEEHLTFSHDGTRIAFSSAGGIYVISTLGGVARLVAEEVRYPRFSPDGQWIVCSSPVTQFTRIYIVPVNGGALRRLQEDFRSAAYPTWSPDGRSILFHGVKIPAGGGIGDGIADWWVTPAEGGEAIRTNAAAAWSQHKLRRTGQFEPIHPTAWLAEGNYVPFAARRGDSVNIWRIAISPDTGKVLGAPEQLTFGSGMEKHPSVAADGRMVFAGLSTNHDIWSLPIDGDRGAVTGEAQRLTHDLSFNGEPYVSADGKKIVYRSDRRGGRGIWLIDIETGRETNILERVSRAVISRDGSKVAFVRRGAHYILDLNGGTPKLVCEDCRNLMDWSGDSQKLLSGGHNRGGGSTYQVLDIVTGVKKDVLHSDQDLLWRARLSPDDRWIGFNVGGGESRGSYMYVAPVREDGPADRSEWIRVSDEESVFDHYCFWAPNSNAIYFASFRDGFLDIWGRRLDPHTKQPVGPMMKVHHFKPGRRWSLRGSNPSWGLSMARDKLVIGLHEMTGNIWMAEPRSDSEMREESPEKL